MLGCRETGKRGDQVCAIGVGKDSFSSAMTVYLIARWPKDAILADVRMVNRVALIDVVPTLVAAR
jgi:hypothetical protein